MSSGGTAGTVVDVKHITMAAILSNCCNVIISHNHPSGNLMPSKEDIDMTRKVKQSLDNCDITLTDHIIVSTEGFRSLANEGEL
jgi:DNA repair protein RadC